MVVLAIDETYTRQAAVVLSSLAATQRPRVPTVVLHSGLSMPALAHLRQVGDRLAWPLDIREVDRVPDVPVSRHVSEATYLRLHAPTLVAADRILYLDSDVLVQGDLSPLLTAKLTKPVAAVQDHYARTFETGRGLPGYRQGDSRTPYFNAGVMLIDTERWRTADVTGRSLRFLRETPQHVRYWDQCALNAVLEDSWQRLDPMWNSFPFTDLLVPCDSRDHPEEASLVDLVGVERRARIIHFAGPLKPWASKYPDGPNRRRYLALLEAVDGPSS